MSVTARAFFYVQQVELLVRRRVEQRSGHPALITAPAGAGALMDALRRARAALIPAAGEAARGIVAAA